TASAVNRGGTAFAVLAGASLSHLLNDTIQALVPALYPMFKAAFALSFTQVGVLLLSAARTFEALLVAAGLMGIGSSIFHPESSRIARMASGGRHGFAQSFFQVGGNLGSSFGPLLAAFLVVPRGQASVAWCAPLAGLAIVVLWRIGRWYRDERIALARHAAHAPRAAAASVSALSTRRVGWALTILG